MPDTTSLEATTTPTGTARSVCPTAPRRPRHIARRLKRAGTNAAAAGLLAAAVRPATALPARLAAGAGLSAIWMRSYVQYRRMGKAQTRREYELMRTASWDAYTRHYNERVPTIEEEFDVWGEYHQHRHEMRYDRVGAAVRSHLPRGGRLLDIGCGSALVADRILDRDATYVGIDFGGRHVAYAVRRFEEMTHPLRLCFGRGDAELLPFADNSFDVVVISEVIEHLLRPQRAVWEIARVLRRGGQLVLTTNNASEVPLRSPLTHCLAWLEKALGAHRPELISLRPWVWPHKIDPDLLAPGAPPVYLPHTHHIYGETKRLMEAAGLSPVEWSTFEFPPPQSASAKWLDSQGELGRYVVDLIEAVAIRTPLVRRLGCHLFILARKTEDPIASSPPPGLWPGPDYNPPGATTS